MKRNSAISLIGCVVSAFIILSCSEKEQTVPVIPQPQQVELHHGHFSFPPSVFEAEGLDDASAAYVNTFREQLDACLADHRKGGALRFITDSGLAAEEYSIDASAKELIVKASGLNGFVYAIQTIKQLLPAEIWGGEQEPDADWTIPAMSIRDYPRFAYRGMHLDCSRHFFDIEEIHRYIDVMVAHKMNRLHWHLTDDQGWRVEIKKYPRLTEVAAWRDGTMVGRDFQSNDGVRYGGYYTQEELRETVAYAAARGVTIIPEIDLPGHMQAALAAYPELGCTGGPYKVLNIWGISDDVLCAGNEKIYTFLEDVMSELIDIFPSEYIHIGGDECPKVRWKVCPKCQKKIQELGFHSDDRFTAEDYLQTYVMNRIEKFLGEHGRRIIGWDEILEGDLSKSATIMSWRGSLGGIRAARSGRDAIMTPNSHFYFDYLQSRDIEGEPVGIGGYVPVDKVYAYEPHDPDMNDEDFSHVLGVQANLWTEYISTNEHLEYMLIPRMSALSEVQWCEPERKDWERFRRDMAGFTKVFDAMGLNYATHLFDGRLDAERAALGEYHHKAQGKPVQLLTVPYSSYRFEAPAELFDGKRGDMDFHSGAWIGFYREPLDVIIEMGRTKFSSVMMEILADKGNYIFAPTAFKALVSDDGENYSELAVATYEPMKSSDKDGVMQFTLDFQETRAKYLRIQSNTIDVLPEWHPGAGARAFLFVDEIVVR